MNNPFELFSYIGPDYFCDREEELQELLDAFQNRRNVVLISDRRLGKTMLIRHLHHFLDKRKKTLPIYIDILNTRSDSEFINKFISEILQKLESSQKTTSKLLGYFQQFRPSITLDAITGNPVVSIDIKSKTEVGASMNAIMNILTNDDRNIQIALDEFQQISNYEDGTIIDSTLRSYFSSAKKHQFSFFWK
jgi:AAA+ ATPase superfamily predicted ATPase